jgi:hypothetical protein
MAYEARPNSANIFQNDRKASSNHSDFSGSMDVELACPHCTERVKASFWVNVWKKMTSSNKPYISLSIKEREYRAPAEGAKDKMEMEPKKKPESSLDDEIPW